LNGCNRREQLNDNYAKTKNEGNREERESQVWNSKKRGCDTERTSHVMKTLWLLDNKLANTELHPSTGMQAPHESAS
jgi:hypothetical protein